jgi:hypothetical protein
MASEVLRGFIHLFGLIERGKRLGLASAFHTLFKYSGKILLYDKCGINQGAKASLIGRHRNSEARFSAILRMTLHNFPRFIDGCWLHRKLRPSTGVELEETHLLSFFPSAGFLRLFAWWALLRARLGLGALGYSPSLLSVQHPGRASSRSPIYRAIILVSGAARS